MAFQKWQGLPRTGLADERTRSALAIATRPTPIKQGPAGRRVEVLIDRQLVLAIEDNEVVRTIHVSTGKPSTPTTIGSFSVYAKFARWWSTPFREWLLWAVAVHRRHRDAPVSGRAGPTPPRTAACASRSTTRAGSSTSTASASPSTCSRRRREDAPRSRARRVRPGVGGARGDRAPTRRPRCSRAS